MNMVMIQINQAHLERHLGQANVIAVEMCRKKLK